MKSRPGPFHTIILALLYFHVQCVQPFSQRSRLNQEFFRTTLPSTVSRSRNPFSWRPSCHTRPHLFSLNLNGDSGNNNDDDDDHQDDFDFSTWARSLRSWPLYPTSKPSPPKAEKQQSLSSTSSQNIPLANLINVEALLMASGEETIDNIEDIELFEFGSYEDDLGDKSRVDSPPADVSPTDEVEAPTPLSILPSLEELGNWEYLLGTLQKSISDLTISNPTIATDIILKEATARIEDFVAEASSAISPSTVQDLIVRASQTLDLENANSFVLTAEKLARQQGLDVSEAAERARETAKFTTDLVKLANGVLVSGYVAGDQIATRKVISEEDLAKDVLKPLFDGYKSASGIQASAQNSAVQKAAEMGDLAGAVYENTVPRSHGLGHSIVANGTTADVAWMVTDSLASEDEFRDAYNVGSTSRKPLLVRTITIRGYDASDESVDREGLLNTVCMATPVTVDTKPDLLIHSGLLSIARSIYRDVVKYIDTTAPTHRVVFNGHSIGGALAILLLFLLTESRGADYVKDKVLRVFSFGSPPIVKTADTFESPKMLNPELKFRCSILESFGLPDSIVYAYVQPWDPIVRLFSSIDPLYPLLGDLGADGKTLYVSGPSRSLRPITRAIIESWEGWPRFRDNFRNTVNQNYTSVGTQHLLLPERVRYLSDRFVSVNVAVPSVETVVRLSSTELLPALEEMFPLDVFQISFVPTAIRSFVHHFFPAYGFPFVEFASKRRGKRSTQTIKEDDARLNEEIINGVASHKDEKERNGVSTKGKDWAEAAAQWILGDGI